MPDSFLGCTDEDDFVLPGSTTNSAANANGAANANSATGEKDGDGQAQAALLARCDKTSEEARRHLEEARRHGTVEDMDTAEEELSVQRSPSPPPSSTLSRSTFRVSNW